VLPSLLGLPLNATTFMGLSFLYVV
jgi:hypothetical protein